MKLIDFCKTIDKAGAFGSTGLIYAKDAHPSLIEQLKLCDEFKTCSSIRIAEAPQFAVDPTTGNLTIDSDEQKVVVQTATYLIPSDENTATELKLQDDCYVWCMMKSPQIMTLEPTSEPTHRYMIRLGIKNN